MCTGQPLRSLLSAIAPTSGNSTAQSADRPLPFAVPETSSSTDTHSTAPHNPTASHTDPYSSPLAKQVFAPCGPAAPAATHPTDAPETPSHASASGRASPLPPRAPHGHPLLAQHAGGGHVGPYTLADKIPDMEEVWWLRLMDMRDARIALEKATDACWSHLAWASLTCDLLATEEKLMGKWVTVFYLQQHVSCTQTCRSAACHT